MKEELIIKNLLKNYTIETTPKVYLNKGSLKEYINKNNWVYITYLPDEDPKKIIETAKKIKDEGLDPVPHLPVRTLENFAELENYIGKLADNAGVDKILVIGGRINV